MPGLHMNADLAIGRRDEATKAIKRKFAEVASEKPYYNELVEEVLQEDFSSDGPALREALLQRFAVAEEKKADPAQEKSFKGVIVDGVRSLSAASFAFEGAVSKLSDDSSLLSSLDQGLAVHLRRIDQPLRREARVMIDLGGRALGFGDECGSALLGFDQLRGGAMLAFGEHLGAALLRLGGDAAGFLVRRAKDRGALGPERARERGFVERGVGGPALRVGQLLLELSDPVLQVAHLTGHRFEVESNLLGVNTTFSLCREVRPDNFGRRLTRGGENSAFVHSLKTTTSGP